MSYRISRLCIPAHGVVRLPSINKCNLGIVVTNHFHIFNNMSQPAEAESLTTELNERSSSRPRHCVTIQPFRDLVELSSRHKTTSRCSPLEQSIPPGITISMDCYYPNGQLADGLSPCNTTAPVSHCCRNGDVCVTNGLCFSTGLMAVVRRGCTDKTFNSTLCPQQCAFGMY